jgi:3-dehydroquinate synthase
VNTEAGEKMRVVQVPLGERGYPIYIGKNIFSALGETWLETVKPGRVLLVSDENVFPLYGGKLIDALVNSGFAVTPVVIPAGEGSKSLTWAENLYTHALEADLDRSSLIIALGGGVVGDLAGFAAATYMRGIPFVQVPTSLLAQVDSSVGGKVAVNHPLGKNLIGSFYQPKLVWVELAALDTLPEREFLAGAAEVVKYGIIMDESFFSYLESHWQAFLAKDPVVLAEVIAACCELKARVVVEDEREAGLRAILNFGHTLGHALEAATSYGYYLHGEAVLAGMLMAVDIAENKEILLPTEAARCRALLSRIGVKRPPVGLGTEQVMASLRYDKKREGETLVFILPEQVGQVAVYRDVDYLLIQRVLDKYFTTSS